MPDSVKEAINSLRCVHFADKEAVVPQTIVEKISVQPAVPYETEFDRDAVQHEIQQTLQRYKAELGNMNLAGGNPKLFDDAGIKNFLDACQGDEAGQEWAAENHNEIYWLASEIIKSSQHLNAGHFFTCFREVNHRFLYDEYFYRIHHYLLVAGDDLRRILLWLTAEGLEIPKGTTLYALDLTHKEASWQYYAEDTQRLLTALDGGKKDPYALYASVPEEVLKNISFFPELDAVTYEVLKDFSASSARTYRELAQQILAKHGLMVKIAEDQLFSGAEGVRISAVEWLVKDGGDPAIETLWRGLSRNKNEQVRARILAALHGLGEDISEYVSPVAFEKLGDKEAQKKLPEALEWVKLSDFPALSWADGSPVSFQVVRWWMVLATKLKLPADSGIFRLYCKDLAPESAQKLSEQILAIWCEQDMRRPSPNESANLPYLLQDIRSGKSSLDETKQPWQGYLQALLDAGWDHHQNTSPSDAIAQSVLPTKGLLALTVFADATKMAEYIRTYLGTAKDRKQQILCLIEALEAKKAPETVAVLAELSRNHHLETVREVAFQAVERYGKAQGWTASQLHDKTLPSAGFAADGVLPLPDEDEKTYGVLNAKYQLVAVRNGQTMKEFSSTSTQTALTKAKKILKTAVPAYRARLRDALLTEETWDAQEFRDVFLNNGVAYRLGSDYLWECSGELFTLDAVPKLNGKVRLAHRTRMDAADAEYWAGQVLGADGQMVNIASDVEPGQLVIDGYRGYVLTNVAVQNKLMPQGWKRDWRRLEKGYNDTWYFALENGLEAHLYFTGERLIFGANKVTASEAVKVALLHLCFKKDDEVVPLTEVPVAFRAFAESAYQAVGKAGKYQADWENYPWQLEMEKHSSRYSAEALERYFERQQ